MSAVAKKITVLIEELDQSLWVAAIDDARRLEGLEVDPADETVRWGSLYWGRVETLDPSLDAAFVNLDGTNIGLLHNRDIRLQRADGTIRKGGDAGIGTILSPGQGLLVQAKSGMLPVKDSRILKAGEKHPVLTMAVALPGRFLIHTPFEQENRVSVRIRDKKLRKQLQGLVDGLDPRQGYILRSAAAGAQTDILIREGRVLRTLWDTLQPHAAGTDPQLLMLGPDAISRTLSDHAGQTIERIEVVTLQHYEAVADWCDVYAPELMTRLKAIEIKGADQGWSLFDHYDLIGSIEDLFDPYILLEGGGSVIIQETAALTAIDVNRGADRRSAIAINADAARAIGRELRIRNLGGAIVIDFLKMAVADRDRLLDALQDAVDGDPCTLQIHGFTPLGMIEMTRHRRTPALQDRFRAAFGTGG